MPLSRGLKTLAESPVNEHKLTFTDKYLLQKQPAARFAQVLHDCTV